MKKHPLPECKSYRYCVAVVKGGKSPFWVLDAKETALTGFRIQGNTRNLQVKLYKIKCLINTILKNGKKNGSGD